jgi:sugar phosphate isomerase/epimerase
VDVCQIEGKKLAKAVTDLGLKLYAIHVGTLHGSNRSAAMYQLPYIKRAIDVLADAGTDQLVFTGGPRESEKPEDLVAAVQKQICQFRRPNETLRSLCCKN